MATFLQSIPAWVGALGWLAVLIGFFMQRKAFMNVVNKTSIKGDDNTVSNTSNQGTQSQGRGDSALSKSASWSTVAGLLLTLLSLLKEWLGKAA